VAFDSAIAQSVFTRLPLNHIRLCLFQLSRVMAPGGRFFATFFEAPASTPYDHRMQQVVRKTWPERDPSRYRRDDLRWAAETVADWSVRYIGDWGSPQGSAHDGVHASPPRHAYDLATRARAARGRRPAPPFAALAPAKVAECFYR
jgi:hypothetical protein